MKMINFPVGPPLRKGWPEEIPCEHQTIPEVLTALIQANGYQTMVEVGVNKRKISLALLDQLPDLVIHAIDKNIHNFYTPGDVEKYHGRLILIQADGPSGAEDIIDSSQGLIYFDRHTLWTELRLDILAYRPKLSAGGIMCGNRVDHTGVYKAVRHLINGWDIVLGSVWIERRK